MLDKERIHAKLDELYQYLSELSQIEPKNFDEFQKIEKKGATTSSTVMRSLRWTSISGVISPRYWTKLKVKEP